MGRLQKEQFEGQIEAAVEPAESAGAARIAAVSPTRDLATWPIGKNLPLFKIVVACSSWIFLAFILIFKNITSKYCLGC